MRLIDGDALVESIKEELWHWDTVDGINAITVLKQTISDINNMPTIPQPEIIRCKDCKHNPKITWFGCPLAHCSETQRPETAWCWKAERREVSK